MPQKSLIDKSALPEKEPGQGKRAAALFFENIDCLCLKTISRSSVKTGNEGVKKRPLLIPGASRSGLTVSIVEGIGKIRFV